MNLTLHGTGAGEPGGDRLASAASARFDDGSLLLLDAGEGCSRAMLRDGVDPQRVATVAISHMHADHWCGYPNLLMAWVGGKREEPVTVHVPPGMRDFFEQLHHASYLFRERLTFDLEYRDLAPFDLRDGWRVEPFPTTHLESVEELAAKYHSPTTAYGYLLMKEARKIVLSQDIKREEDLHPVIDGAELLICEAAHVKPENILTMARRHGVKKVIFTHIPPRDVEFPERFEGIDWSIARDGERVAI